MFGAYCLEMGESYLKLKLAYLDAVSKGQEELPEVDPKKFKLRSIAAKNLLGGQIGKWLYHWIVSDRIHAQGFVFWMKRSAPAASPLAIRKAEKETLELLTTPQEQLQFQLNPLDYKDSPDPLYPPTAPLDQKFDISILEQEVRRTVKEVFRDWKSAEWKNVATFHLPSANAHFDVKRNESGARAKLAHQTPSKSTLARELCALTGHFEERHNVQQLAEGCTCGTCFSSETVMVPVQAGSRRQLIDMAYSNCDRCVVGLARFHLRRPNEEIYNRFPMIHWFDVVLEAWQLRDVAFHNRILGSDPKAKIIAFSEPLKIRSVTCGPEEEYYWASYLQKSIHGHLRAHPTFRLIGDELSREMISTVFRTRLPDGWFYVSGDYRAATNLISSRLSLACAEEIAAALELPPFLAKLLVDCLVHHLFPVSDPSGDREIPQQNGQLMGSPVSFPVLCLINAALTRYSQLGSGYERPDVKLHEMALLVNGDDVAFRTCLAGYRFWKKVMPVGGLFPSMGKNFTSKDFLVINSRMFELVTESFGGHRTLREEVPQPMRSSYSTRPRLVPRLLTEGPWEGKSVPSSPLQCDSLPLSERLDLVAVSNPSQAGRLPFCGSPNVVWECRDWHNPDFLGPQSFFKAREWDSEFLSEENRRKNYSEQEIQMSDLKRSLGKKSRFREQLTDIRAFFRPEGYAILPGLQKSWLASSRGERRHKLNLLFLQTWRPILDLSSNSRPNTTPYTTDWFLPTGLGGLGLEDTSGRGMAVHSKACLRLAAYLLREQVLIPPMPVLGEKPAIGIEATRRITSFLSPLEEQSRPLWRLESDSDLPVRRISQFALLPSGYVEVDDLVQAQTRICYSDAFYICSDAQLAGIALAPDPEGDCPDAIRNLLGNFARMDKFGCELKLTSDLLLRDQQWSSYWQKEKKAMWKDEAPLTQRELDSFTPIRRVVRCSPNDVPKVELRDPTEVWRPSILPNLPILPQTESPDLVARTSSVFPFSIALDRFTSQAVERLRRHGELSHSYLVDIHPDIGLGQCPFKIRATELCAISY
jgi:hypothetical protein